MNKITAIYVRRSVSDHDKGNNSLSIDAQKTECIKFLGENADYRIYCDMLNRKMIQIYFSLFAGSFYKNGFTFCRMGSFFTAGSNHSHTANEPGR